MPETRSVEEIVRNPDVMPHRHGDGDGTTSRLVEEQHVLIADVKRLVAENERLREAARSLQTVLAEHERRLGQLIERDTEVSS